MTTGWDSGFWDDGYWDGDEAVVTVRVDVTSSVRAGIDVTTSTLLVDVTTRSEG